MNKVIEQLETVKAVMSDLTDNTNIPLEIRTHAWNFEILLRHAIQTGKCEHKNLTPNIEHLHVDKYKTETCKDCGVIVKMERQ